jgi:HD-GYP domain-containing protein (c-di-GMP phosphodiesterase class II)
LASVEGELQMTRASTGTRFRLADVLGGLSRVADLGFGLPPGEAMRSCVVATALARELDLPEAEVTDTFYAALLMHIGCVSMAHETAALFGNELTLTRAVAMTNLGDPQDLTDTLLPEMSRGLDASARERLGATLITSGPSFGRLYDTASGEVSRATARRIGLPPGTQRALFEDAESWSGEGAPRGLKGDEIALPARIVRVASDAAFFDDIGNGEMAVDAVKKRSGGTLDPAIVDVFVRHSGTILGELNAGDPQEQILEVEPHPVAERDENQLIDIATAFADAADLKTPFMHQHSTGVATLASSAAERGGLDRAQVKELRIAALLHDLGRVGVSDAIWEKPGALTTAEWEMVRTHPYHSERVLATSRSLEPVARTAGMHHERSDGSGYHRGSRGAEIPMAARVLGAADAFVAMTQERPHRAAMEPEQAAHELKKDAREAKLDPEAVAAVLGVAGQGDGGGRTLRPSGLSEREIEVLRLLAQGYSNPDIAERLTVSRRTAEHHVQHIYAKIGVSTRPGAALFALQHHLLS